MAETDGEWLDVEEAPTLLDFHANTVYRLIREGRLPALRFPVRIRREDLDGLIERCRIKPGELTHLDQYADGVHVALAGLTTKEGRPDRRFGPRTRRTIPENA